MRRLLYIAIIAVVLTSCKSSANVDSVVDVSKTEFKAERNIVDTIILHKGIFKKQLMSNGKLSAAEKSDLNFTRNGKIFEIAVHNGATVEKGSIIASLDKTESEILYKRSKNDLQKAQIDLKDYLIGQGYGQKDTTNVPEEVMDMARMKSGYNIALSSLEQAKYNLENSTIIAPFAGKIANIKQKRNELSSGVFCSLINDSYFDVDFPILESEISLVKIGSEVIVSPFNNREVKYHGRVAEINPMVDKNGQITIKARIQNSSNSLMDGMNVSVRIENNVNNMFVVPKSAVVIRDNLEVMFRYKDGKAMWTYINIVMSNSDSHAIVANSDRNALFSEGDAVIVEGNFNLADNSEVEVK